MNEDVIRCIYKYMQELKVKINESKIDIENYDNEIDNATEDEQKLSIEYNMLYYSYKFFKIKFYLTIIFTLGKSYKFRNCYYKLLKSAFENELAELDGKYNNIIECLGIYEHERIKIKESLNKYNKYFDQIEMFIECYKNMSDKERETLILK